MGRPRIVSVAGTTRTGSSGERLVRAVLAATEAQGAETRMFDGPELAALLHFAPEDSQRSDAQRALIGAAREADGLVIGIAVNAIGRKPFGQDSRLVDRAILAMAKAQATPIMRMARA